MLFMYLACPGTTSFPAICRVAFQLLVPTKNKIAVVFVWVGLNESSASELGLKNKNLKLLQERMNLSSPQRLPLGIPIKIAITEN